MRKSPAVFFRKTIEAVAFFLRRYSNRTIMGEATQYYVLMCTDRLCKYAALRNVVIFYGRRIPAMSDPSLYIIIAIVVLIIALIFYLNKSKKDNASKSSGGGGSTPVRVVDDSNTTRVVIADPVPDAPVKTGTGMSSALYIPPEMLGDSRDAMVRAKVDETIRNFNWDADGGRSEFLYTLQLNKSGWICPYCEGENSNEDSRCVICGERIGA